ncbi:MAG: TIM barrel protein [Kiritimatiellaeota bacterium]|nr:TIM barrel protein [Kiritimatiellota bacterium]
MFFCNIAIAAFCTHFFSLTDPAQRGAYLDGLRESAAAAKKYGVPVIISQVGADTGAPREAQRASLVDGLRAAAPMLEDAGVTLAIEPLNTRYNHPGYYLTHSAEAFAITREVASPRVKVLYDIYHQQITEGDIINTLSANIAEVAHLHVAGHPGRHELDNGEINCPGIFRALDRMGYAGFIGLEYFPLRDPAAGLREISGAP